MDTRLRIATALLLTLCAVVARRGTAQTSSSALHLEAAVGVLIPTRALYAGDWGSTWLQTTPVLSVAATVRRGSSLGLRVRGAAALKAGTTSTIVSGPGSGESESPDGRTFAVVGEVLTSIPRARFLELAAGLGARWYRFAGGDCAGPCGTPRPSTTSIAGSLSIAAQRDLGAVGLGIEGTSLLSRNAGRWMHDVLAGIRVRF